MPAATNYEQERVELTKILSSGIFNRAPSLSQLLVYVCEKHFEGEGEQIKEYNIAIEALGRHADFDQKRDSIVRVEAHRLRKRLKEFYLGPGADHPIQIVIPPGQYAPAFVLRDPPTALEPIPSPPLVLDAPNPRPLEERGRELQTVERPASEYTAVVKAWPRSGMWVTWAGFLIAIAVIGFVFLPRRPGSQRETHMEAAPLVLTSAPGNEIRILAGSPRAYTDHLGRSWTPDRFFSGGTLESTSNHPVQGTRDEQIYQTRREGAFRYRIPLSPGVYELRLHFAEVIYGESNLAGGGETSRLFNVLINGAVALEALDVIAGAGPNTAHIRVFRDVHPDSDGFLQLQFEPVTGLAFLNAIEIAPGIPGQLKPIRILARNQPYIDRHGNLWEADDYHRGGIQVVRPHDVQGVPDPEIYRGERFGNIVYEIPVAPGRYTVVLHFAETWFGPDKPQKGGAGSRSFDVLCNGTALLRDFDIYQEAGGSDRALNKTFRGLEASPQGKLILSFVPKRNYACINAIEVLAEAEPRK